MLGEEWGMGGGEEGKTEEGRKGKGRETQSGGERQRIGGCMQTPLELEVCPSLCLLEALEGGSVSLPFFAGPSKLLDLVTLWESSNLFSGPLAEQGRGEGAWKTWFQEAPWQPDVKGDSRQTLTPPLPTPSTHTRDSASLALYEEQNVSSGEGAHPRGGLPGVSVIRTGEKAGGWGKQ